MKNICRLSALLLAFPASLSGQILDDSSQQKYSLRTVIIRTEKEMMHNQDKLAPDTILEGFSEKLDFIRKNNRDYQNLGTFASASRPLLFELPASIGKRNGIEAYDALIPNRQEIPYMKTLTPFSRIRYMQGARQRAMLQTTFSVNPASNLNFAGYYQRLDALRVINVSQQDEKETDHHSVWVSSNFHSKNGRYLAWAHYQHLNHIQFLTGGARPGGPGYTDSLFEFTNIMKAGLNRDARNNDLRNNWHFSHQYRTGNGFFIRSTHSRQKQVYRFRDPKPDSLYYSRDGFFFQEEGPKAGNPDSLSIERVFEVWENSGGIGWQDSVRNIYLFAKRRDWTFKNDDFPGSRQGFDFFAGLQANGKLASINYFMTAEFLNLNEYDFNARISWNGINLTGRLFAFRPSLAQETFQSKNLLYEKRLQSSNALQFQIDKKFNWKNIRVRPHVEWMSVNKGIAFDSTFRPFQSIGTSTFFYPGIDIQTSIGKRLHSLTRFIKPLQSGTRIAGIPGYCLYSSHWYDLVKNKKAYAVQVGFSLDWRSDWTSELFAAPNAQWYVQQRLSVPTYFMVNTFVQMRIDRVRLYFRVHNTMQGVGGKGYVAAPGYPAQRRLFELGLDWTFFD